MQLENYEIITDYQGAEETVDIDHDPKYAKKKKVPDFKPPRDGEYGENDQAMIAAHLKKHPIVTTSSTK